MSELNDLINQAVDNASSKSGDIDEVYAKIMEISPNSRPQAKTIVSDYRQASMHLPKFYNEQGCESVATIQVRNVFDGVNQATRELFVKKTIELIPVPGEAVGLDKSFPPRFSDGSINYAHVYSPEDPNDDGANTAYRELVYFQERAKLYGTDEEWGVGYTTQRVLAKEKNSEGKHRVILAASNRRGVDENLMRDEINESINRNNQMLDDSIYDVTETAPQDSITAYKIDLSQPAYLRDLLLGKTKDSFLLKEIQESYRERSQIVETFGDGYATFFTGESPKVLNFRGTLINDSYGNWKSNFIYAYSNLFRGTKLAQLKLKILLTYDFIIAEGYMLNFVCNTNCDDEVNVSFSFDLLVTNYTDLGLVMFSPPDVVFGVEDQRVFSNASSIHDVIGGQS